METVPGCTHALPISVKMKWSSRFGQMKYFATVLNQILLQCRFQIKSYFVKKLKLMTVVGTRPKIICLSRVMAVCDQYFDHIIVHTGQNYDYELNEIFLY